MPAPVVQFAAMGDGGRIAFHVLGTGPGIAMLYPYHVNHIALNWRVPLHRAATNFLGRHLTVINLDFRGAGLSAPLHEDLTLESFSEALKAVLAAAGQERVALCAMGAAGLMACHFAVRQPKRVTRLVFIASGDSPANQHLLHMRQSTPDIEAELRGTLLGGVGDTRNAAALARVARASLTPGMLAAWEALLARENLTALARAVKAPALYLHAADDQLVPLSGAQALVSELPEATLRIVPGRSGMDVWRNRAAVEEILDFVRIGDSSAAMPRLRRRRSKGSDYPAGLSEREAEVIRLLALGRTNRQIADELFISLNTVSHHLRNIFSKTRASNRTEAAAFALETGIASHRRQAPRHR
jgi:DNA-binding CsgD family transcriptional regulator/pimeloyl-ACP methyl ester carboxylesterase